MTPFPHYLRRRRQMTRDRFWVLVSQNLGMGLCLGWVIAGTAHAIAILAQNLFAIYMRAGL